MLFHDEPWPDGTPSWVDLMVPDQAKAVAFYGGLLGWDVQAGGEETGFYGMAMLQGRPVAGIGQTAGGPGDARGVDDLPVGVRCGQGGRGDHRGRMAGSWCR